VNPVLGECGEMICNVKLFRVTKILDHAYSSYTKGLLKYCEARGDLDGADEMKTVLARVTI